MKRTDWYPGEIEPVHVGYYQCRCCLKLLYWDGYRWMSSEHCGLPLLNQRFEWRGVKK